MQDSIRDKIWIAFLDEEGKKVQGYFDKVEETDSKLKIKSGTNIITVPFNRVLKVKEKDERGSG